MQNLISFWPTKIKALLTTVNPGCLTIFSQWPSGNVSRYDIPTKNNDLITFLLESVFEISIDKNSNFDELFPIDCILVLDCDDNNYLIAIGSEKTKLFYDFDNEMLSSKLEIFESFKLKKEEKIRSQINDLEQELSNISTQKFDNE